MSNLLDLYTQLNCPYCEIMKQKLSDWGYEYNEINIQYSIEGKQFLKDPGHRVVPQVYFGSTHVNKFDTMQMTQERLEAAMYPSQDSGVEMFG